MNRRSLPRAIAIMAAAALALAGCTRGSTTSDGFRTSASMRTLVVDDAFDLRTSDPARLSGRTGAIVGKALYETALTFEGSDLTEPRPQLASYTQSPDARTLTLRLDGEHLFSSGNPVSADDIVWSYRRVIAIGAAPSSLLRDANGRSLDVRRTSADTVTLTSSAANPQLPAILTSPSLGILDSSTLVRHGGTATKDDAAARWLDGNSAGSGPYVLQSVEPGTKIVLEPNRRYTGAKPVYGRVVLQNVPGPEQRLNVEAGQANVALGLDAGEVQGLNPGTTKVASGTSSSILHLWLSQGGVASRGVTNDPALVTAVRRGIDRRELLELAGAGSVQPGGLVPRQFLGAIEPEATTRTDTRGAIEALRRSRYSGQTITLAYPSDGAAGIDVPAVAGAVRSQLAEIGIAVELDPMPLATLLAEHRRGALQAGLLVRDPDFPDPADSLVFSPGEPLGLAAGWTKGMAPDVTRAKEAALAATGPRRATAFDVWQRAMNASGPFVPLVQPGLHLVTTSSVSSIAAHPAWTVDLAAIR